MTASTIIIAANAFLLRFLSGMRAVHSEKLLDILYPMFYIILYRGTVYSSFGGKYLEGIVVKGSGAFGNERHGAARGARFCGVSGG